MKNTFKCSKCGIYTMKEKCPKCKNKTINPKPPKFSLDDKYGKYRRKAKKEIFIAEGLL